MLNHLANLIKKFQVLILLFVLVILFLGFIQGSEWSWNPDEIVKRANWALTGDYQFNNDFLYPTLPLYVMYFIGKSVYALDYSRLVFFTTSRWLSALLGVSSVLLIYLSARVVRKSVRVGLIALFLAASSHVLAINAHYAHNDIYQLFFVCLALYFMLRTLLDRADLWFYLTCLSIGLAASSKYTAGILFPGALLAYSMGSRSGWRLLRAVLLGGMVCFGGYALGTPLALLNPLYYFSNLLSALALQRSFGMQADSLIGLFGQWGILVNAFNPWMLALYALALVGTLAISVHTWQKAGSPDPVTGSKLVMLVCILLLDLPIAQSYNYQERFFLPMLPFFAVLTALFLDEGLTYLVQRRLKMALIGFSILAGAVILVSAGYVLSATLLFKYEPRIAAGNYLRSAIVEGKTLEFTLYPPVIPENYFKSATQYPLFFKKVADWVPSPNANQGEEGIETRRPDYLVIDSFTYERFQDEETCQTTAKDCAFFRNLLDGKTHYQWLKTFHYEIPRFLPQLETAFLNPVIKIYERK